MHAFLASIPHWALVLVVGGLIGIESIGLPLPGETVLVTAVLVGHEDGVAPWAIFVATVVGAIVGDNLGYLIGRLVGVPVLDWLRRRFPRVVRTETIVAAARMMTRYGAWAVFAARFVALLRVLSGPLAGTLRMRYRRFFLANAAGAVVWAGAVTLAVTLAGDEVRRFMHSASWVLLVAAAVLVLAVVVVVIVRRRRAASHPAAPLTPQQRTMPLAQLLTEISHETARRPHR